MPLCSNRSRRFDFLQKWSLSGLAVLATVHLAAAQEGVLPPLGVERVEVTRFFWVDLPGTEGSTTAQATLQERAVPVEILAVEIPGGWTEAAGQALVFVGSAGSLVERIALVSLGRDTSEDRALRLEQVVGVRFPTRHGRFNVLFASRLNELPEFARLEIERRVRLLRLERKLYEEAYYRVSGVGHSDIRWIHALGPDLVVLPKKWLKILEGDQSVLTGKSLMPSDETCFQLGPFDLCLDARMLIESMRDARHPRGKTRVLIRKRWPEREATYGLVLWSRPFAASSRVVFQVATQGRGGLPGEPRSVFHQTPELPGPMTVQRPGTKQAVSANPTPRSRPSKKER